MSGLLVAAGLATEWARFADVVSGREGDDLILRLEDHFSPRQIGLIASYFGANALRAFSRALQARATDEPTDPDIEIELGPLAGK